MKKLTKSLLAIIIGAAILSNPYIASANNMPISTHNNQDKIHIITKHRVHNGKMQHRRYDTDTKKWVDPDWIDD